jgi:prepilin-type N-terminal cleavage/methylation domain-containing protein
MKTSTNHSQAGFSLIEMLVVVAILSIVLGVVLRQIAVVQQRSQTESTKVDMTQQARESLDQMIHDIHMAGYPNAKMFWSSALSSPYNNQPGVAAGCNPSTGGCTGATSGLVKIQYDGGSNAVLWMEGDMDGDGQVDVVRYRYVATSTESNNCPCIERGWTSPKVAGDPVSTNVTYHVAVENVNSMTLTAYTSNGATVNISSAIDIDNDPGTVESIRTLAITLSVKGSSLDMPTKQYPTVVLSGLGQFRN